MRIGTFGAWTAAIGSIGAGALTQIPEYSFMALPLAVLSAAIWLIVLVAFLFAHRDTARSLPQHANFWPIIFVTAVVVGVGIDRAPQWVEATRVYLATKSQVAAARDWLKLANEIYLDIPALTWDMTRPPPNLPEAQYNALWVQHSDREINRINQQLDLMRQKYRSRIVVARDKMVSFGIPVDKAPPRDMFLEDPSMGLTNKFSFESWATKLQVEADRILASSNVKE